MFASQGAVVHFVAQQSLRMQRGRHVQRFVIIVRACHCDEAGSRVGSNHLQKIGEPGSAEASNYVPPFNADVTRVLARACQGLDLGQSVFARLLHCATHGQRPVFEDYAWIIDVITIDGKLLEWAQLGIGKSWRQMTGAEKPRRSPVAEGNSILQQRLTQTGDSKGSQSYHGRDL